MSMTKPKSLRDENIVGCNEKCWIPVPCPICGTNLPPSGRSASPETIGGGCCLEHQHSKINTRHLWSIHDSDRYYSDPDGWKKHLEECEKCREDNNA